MSETPSPSKKMSPLVRILIAIGGVLAMVAGITQMMGGIEKLRGGSLSSETKALMDDVEIAVQAGNKASLEAQPLFQKLLNECEAQGLDAVRTTQGGEIDRVAGLWGTASKQFVVAGSKCGDALKGEKTDWRRKFLEQKIVSYTNLSLARAANETMTLALKEPALKTAEDLLGRINPTIQRRDELVKLADEAQAKAQDLVPK